MRSNELCRPESRRQDRTTTQRPVAVVVTAARNLLTHSDVRPPNSSPMTDTMATGVVRKVVRDVPGREGGRVPDVGRTPADSATGSRP